MKDDGYSILDLQRDQMLMDALFRITALENLLIRKNIVTDDEIQKEIVEISSVVAKSAVDSIATQISSGDMASVDKIIDDLMNESNKKKNNKKAN